MQNDTRPRFEVAAIDHVQDAAILQLHPALLAWLILFDVIGFRSLHHGLISLILLIFVLLLGLVGFFSYFIFTAVIDAFLVLVQNAPQYISKGLLTLQEWAEFLRQRFPPEMQQQINEFILEVGAIVGNAIKDVFTRGVSFIPSTFSLILGFASLPIFLFYILKDSEKLNKGLYSALSPWLAEHVKNIAFIIDRVVGRYIRAQLLLGLVVAYLCFIGLLILNIFC